MPVIGEVLQDEGDEGSLARKSERLQEDPQGFVDAKADKVERLDEGFQDRQVLPVRQVLAWNNDAILIPGNYLSFEAVQIITFSGQIQNN